MPKSFSDSFDECWMITSPKTLPKIKMDPRSMEGSSCPKEIPNLASPIPVLPLPPNFVAGLPGWEYYLRVKKTVEVWEVLKATQMRRTEEWMDGWMDGWNGSAEPENPINPINLTAMFHPPMSWPAFSIESFEIPPAPL